MPDRFFDITTEASRAALGASSTPQLLYLLLDVRPARPEEVRRTPLNLCLVIDRSTSMSGRRLANVRAAATMIVENLAPEDNLSVVAFSDRASVIVAAGRVEDKKQLLNRVRRIQAAGGTEVYQGLEAGYRELRRAPLAQHTNHLILLTDGHTYGDVEACLKVVRAGARDGVNLSAFGLGPEWNEHFLDSLAAISGGESAYIATPGQVVQALQQCLQGLGAVYAHNVRLAREFPEPFQLVSAFRVSPSAQPMGENGDSLRLGVVEGSVPLSFLLEFTVAPQKPGTKLALPLKLTADIPSESVRNHVIRLVREFPIVEEASEGEPPEMLLAAVQAWNFHQMNDNVWDDIEKGNLHRATTRINQLAGRLVDAGHTKLAQQLRAETQRIALGTGVSPEGRKALTFATRSLLTQTVRLRTTDDEPLS